MTNTTARTPGPWVVHEMTANPRAWGIHAKSWNGPHLGSFNKEANAAFIVRAANSHDELTAIAQMVDAWGNGLRHLTDHESKMVKAARAALAKARQP